MPLGYILTNLLAQIVSMGEREIFFFGKLLLFYNSAKNPTSLGKNTRLSKYYSAEEQLLVRESMKGDRRAQLRLYRKYVRAMYNTVIRMVPNTRDAEDIVQEAFVAVFKNLKSFKGDSSLGAWIKRITINRSLNFIRQKGKVRFVQLEERTEGVSSPDGDAEFWNMQAIQSAIKNLPQGCRLVFSLYLLEGYQHQEIAEFLGISESTSKTQYRRAKILLQEKLKSPYYEGG